MNKMERNIRFAEEATDEREGLDGNEFFIENKTGKELMEEEKKVLIISGGKKIDAVGKISMREGRNIYIGQEFSGQKAVELPNNFVAVLKDSDGGFEIEAIFELGQNEKGQKSSERIEVAEAKACSKTLKDEIERLEERLKVGYEVELISEKTEENEIRKIKAKMIEAMEKSGAITYGANGEIICDLEKIRNLRGKMFEDARHFMLKKIKIKPSWQNLVMEIFADKKVLSQEDYEKKISGDKNIKEKPLFYLPRSKEEACNLEKIRQADFYLTISDFSTTEVDKINQVFKKRAGVSALESEMAVRIYHPNYGAGYRSNNGSLFVRSDIRNKDSKFIKISMDWLYGRSNYYSGCVIKEILMHTPKIGILDERFDNIRESGLLTENDFGQSENTKTSDLFRLEKIIGIKGGTNFGTVYIDESGKKRFAHAQYTLGTEFEGKKIVKLEENLYGIVDEVKGIKRVTHIIKSASIEAIRKKQEEYRKKYQKEPRPASVHFGKRDPNSPKPVLFEAINLSPKREKETPEEYAERVASFNAVREYNKLQEITIDLSRNANIGIHNLSLQEQNALTTFAFQSNERYKRLMGFAKEFGLKGLKSFLACEYGMNMGDVILDLGEKLPQEQAEKLFFKYSEIVNEADKVLEMVKGFNKEITPEIENKIKENLLRKGKDLLFSFHQKLIRSEKVEEMERDLENIKSDIILFASTFKEISKNQEVSVTEMKAVNIETKRGSELSPKEREDMLRIFITNWEIGVPEKLFKHLVNDFEAVLEGDSEFYLYKYHGEILSFIRFKDLGNHHVYVGSFNVRSEGKGAEFGATMAKVAIDNKAKDNIIEATVYSGKDNLLQYYRDKFKLFLTETINNYDGTGETFYRLERNDIENESSARAA